MTLSSFGTQINGYRNDGWRATGIPYLSKNFFFCLKGCFSCVHVDLFVVVAVVVFSSLPEQAFILYIFLLINFLRNEHRPPLPPSTFFEGPEKV